MPKQNNQSAAEAPPTESIRVEDLPLEQNFTYRIADVGWVLNRQAIGILKSVSGLGLNEWRVLRIVASNTGTSNTEISRRIGMDKSIISRSLGSLESAGLMVLKRNREDRRKIDIQMTKEGKAVYQRTLPYMHARQQYLVDSLDPDEQRVFARILDKIRQAAIFWEQHPFDSSDGSKPPKSPGKSGKTGKSEDK